MSKLLLGAAVGLLLIVLSIVMWQAGGTEESSAGMTPAETDDLETMLRQARTRQFENARQSYRLGPKTSTSIPAAGYDNLLVAIQEGQKSGEFSRVGIELYGEVLFDLVNKNVKIAYLPFHVRRLRHQALSLDVPQGLYARVAGPVLEHPELLLYEPALRADVIDYHIMFGENSAQIAGGVHVHWDKALSLLPQLIREQRDNPSEQVEVRRHPLRQLARIAGTYNNSKAMKLFKQTLGLLATKSQNLQQFNSWYHRLVEEENASYWSGDEFTNSEFFRESRSSVKQTRNWMVGLFKFYSTGPSLDRGVPRLTKATMGLRDDSRHMYLLDLAEALRDEANRLELLLTEKAEPYSRDRAKQLYEVAWGAIRMGDKSLLESILPQLHGYGDEVRAVFAMLTAALHYLKGDHETALVTIAEHLPERSSFLSPTQLADWRAIIREERLPSAEPHEVGQILLQVGVMWDDMREFAFLEQTIERLRGEQTHERDRHYLEYLKCLLDYRLKRTAGLQDRIYILLDREQQPPGMKRSDLASLAAAIDRRVEDLDEIQARRDRILRGLDGASETTQAPGVLTEVMGSVQDHSRAELRALAIAWQTRMDMSEGAYLDSAEGQEALAELKRRLDTHGGLAIELEEKWLALKDHLLDLMGSLRAAGDLQGALAVLNMAKGLVKNRPYYRLEEARVLKLMAEAVARDQVAKRRQAWLVTAEAFQDAAESDFGDLYLLYDAGMAYLQADQLDRAQEMLLDFDPSRHGRGGGVGESLYWSKKLNLAKIHRLQGRPEMALQRLSDGKVDEDPGVAVPKIEIWFERALNHEDLGELDLALSIYRDVMNELTEVMSPRYLTALYRRARLLHREAARREGSATVSTEEMATRLLESRNAWVEFARKLPLLAVKDSSFHYDPRQAEALYLAGVRYMDAKEHEVAKEYFQRLKVAAKSALSQAVIVPSDRIRWRRFQLKGAYALADAQFSLSEFDLARIHYQEAVELDPEAGEIVWGFVSMGACYEKLNEPKAALQAYQQGKQRLQSLSAPALAEQPLDRGREFWMDEFGRRIAKLSLVAN